MAEWAFWLQQTKITEVSTTNESAADTKDPNLGG